MMHQDMRGLIKRRANHLVSASTDPSIIVNLPRAVSPWRQSKMCPNISRSLEAFRRIHSGHIGQRDNDADAGNCHQSPTDGITPGELNAKPIEAFKCFDYGASGAQERLHNRRQTWVTCDQFEDTPFEAALRDGTDPEPKNLQGPSLRTALVTDMRRKRAS